MLIHNGVLRKTLLDVFGISMEPRVFIGIVLVVLGVVHILMTYGAYIESYVKKAHISGFPCVGLVFILAGGLVSGIKLLMLLGLADPGPWMFIYSFLVEYDYNKRIYEYIESNSFMPDSKYDPEREQNLRVKVSMGGKDMEMSYRINNPYILNGMRMMFAIIFDENGNRYILLDRRKGELERIPFAEDRVQIDDPDGKTGPMTIEMMSYDK